MGMVAGRYWSVQWTVQGNSPELKRELGEWLWDGCSRVTEGMTLPECIVGGNQTVKDKEKMQVRCSGWWSEEEGGCYLGWKQNCDSVIWLIWLSGVVAVKNKYM
jgi:hypothetical protein